MINSTLERNFISMIILSLSSLFVYSQTEKVIIDGKSYYVYPHQQAVVGIQDYYLNFADSKEVIKRDDRNEKIVSVTEEPITELEKKKAVKFPKSYKKYLKEFEEILEKYPYFMVSTDNSITIDPTPSLVSLPDGDYVMFYRDIPYISKRVLRYKNDVVAAYFSIRNNVIEGNSTWYTPDGKVVKTGNYLNSEKTGPWKWFEYTQKLDETYSYDLKESLESRLQKLVYDTTKTTITFLDGLKDGSYTMHRNQELMTSGNFLADKMSGTWEVYAYKTTVSFDKKGKLIITRGKDKILIDRYTLRSDNKRGKSPIIRHGIIPYEFMGFNRSDSLVLVNSSQSSAAFDELNSGYEVDFPDFTSFLSIHEKETENLELPEEELTSYEGEEAYEDEYYDYIPELEFSTDANKNYNPNEFYEFVNKKRYKLNDLIDSMGYLYAYEGIVEHYYENGQLQYRFEVKDGKLLKEEPVYWDNGTIANEVVFIADSNQYMQRFYDYNGVKYYETWHDSKGNILNNPSNLKPDIITIDNKDYDRNYGNPTIIYSEDKEIKKDAMPEKILLIEELFKIDSSVAKAAYFYPKIRTLNVFERNLMGDTVSTQEVIFSEDYMNVNAIQTRQYKNLTLRTIQNGTLDEYWKASLSDTVPIEKLAFYWEYKYAIEKDNELLVNGKPFTGTFQLTDKTGGFSVKATDKSIQLTLPNMKTDLKLYQSAVKAYLKSNKRNDILLGYVSEFGGSGQLSHVISGFFSELYGTFSALYERPAYKLDGQLQSEDEELYSRSVASGEISVLTNAAGKYLNGKAEGIWVYKDQSGKVRSTIGYKNGEPHGDSFDYGVAFPKPKPKKELEEEYYGYEDPIEKYEEYPLKKTYYLESKSTYRNGNLQGPYTTMNWKGDTLTYSNFVDGAKEGLEFKRNKLFFSQSYYRNGYLDGNAKTYFTNPGQDSVLIFDLGFKNGALQGESVAYHSNGKLAKKGFFLTGQPIDDYEAYDTLGFKYQYVKFQYNQPVEEKIWEENELSVRYEFDWRDSIPFNFADITNSSSIDQLIYQAGYSDYGLYEPYYGRPSLVNKSGIDYHITKYYPNDTIARTGMISKGIKTGCWKYFNYFGKKLMEVEYFDSIITVNDSIKFKSKGILYYLDEHDNPLSKNWIIEKFEKYDCSHTDHNEERMLYCFWEKDTTQHRKNGYVKNYYDNGSIQNEGWVKDGLPTGIWKLYDVNGNLNQVGEYVMGKRNGRWLKGDLGSVKNMSEICLNPNLENLDAILSYQEKLLDVSVITYRIGKELKRKYYGINMNNGDAPEGYYGEDDMYMNYAE